MQPFEQLYSLTDRDLETVLIEPFIRRATVSLGVGSIDGIVDFRWPVDRALILNRAVYGCQSEAATVWQQVFLNVSGGGAEVSVDAHGGTSGVPFLAGGTLNSAGAGGVVSAGLDMLIPAGSFLRFRALRTGTTGVATATVDLVGYLIPPGTIARGF